MGRFDIDEVVDGIKRIMQVMGTWPQQSPSTFYKILGYTTITMKTFLFTTTLTQVFSNFSDLPSVSFGICSSLAAFLGVGKQAIIFYNKPNFFVIINSLKRPILAVHKDHLDIYLEEKVRWCNILRPTFFFSTLGTGIIAIVSSMFDKKMERPLPMPFPVDMSEYPLGIYYLVWFLQSIGILLTCCNMPCLDGLIFTFIAIATAELRILREKISNSISHFPPETQFTETRQQVFEINRFLKHCVRHHLAIERYIATIEETFTVAFLLQLIVSIIVTCLTAFNFVLLPVTSIDFGRCVLFFFASLLQLIFFCVPANEIILQSQKIRDACYMADWAGCDPSIRKTLFIIMERTKRPFSLTAASFVKLSLDTFVDVLKSAFSYFSVIMQLYGDSGNK